MKIMQVTQKIEKLAKQLLVVGDPNRIRILCFLLSKKSACVTEIAENLGLSAATTSHHLLILAKENLLLSNRNGKKICYALSELQLLKDLKKIICKNK